MLTKRITFLIIVCLIVTFNKKQNVLAQSQRTIYQKIQQENSFSGFSSLIRSNRVAKLNLHFESVTVFVPENRALKRYIKEHEDLSSDIGFYHMSFEPKTLDKLRTTHFMRSSKLENPPLWITNIGQDIYVNNARIIQDKSDYIAVRRSNDLEKTQVLHMIDEVLDPVIPSPKFAPSAYDFLSAADKWQLGPTATVASFFHKVQEYNLAGAYKQKGGHTFFIPLDSGIDPHNFKMISAHTIRGHIVPDLVLFTRPTEKNSAYDTRANDRFNYVIVSLEERDAKFFVRGLAGGDLGNGNTEDGEFVSEILVPNIPVKNGVVHLVSQPLGIFNRTMKPFPFLPVLEKIANDPELDVFYTIGEETGFNKKFEQTGVKFTYFVPNDKSWFNTRKHDLEPTETDLELLNRHLIVSDTPYSMERLLALSRANSYGDIELNTEGGVLRVAILKIGPDYYLKWGGRYIKVVRPDYECADGIIHILAGPLAHFKQKGDERDAPAEIRIHGGNIDWSTGSAMEYYWRGLGNVLGNVF
ncbi:hypothetical protein NQ317_009366 [Molorchus minor]|uniref:FAS1 domain-containing protein n=1 Tax=Molorchus minor TaxID=1323400 RepID=A0ABQ9JRQ6_9CUCU|nr:hypothetical protein NQ317_009366 [Molorchus minor]